MTATENREFYVIEVKNGEMEAGYMAITCAGDQLADGFYFLPNAEDDPPHRKPFATADEAREAAVEWFADEENED